MMTAMVPSIGNISADTQPATSVVKEAEAAQTLTQSEKVEKKVREFFKNQPVLIEIAECESHFRQFNSDGKILRGEVNRNDIGVMQINTLYHEEIATELGYDIYTLDGNLAYAKELYKRSGTQPWSSSAKCWK